MQWSLSKYRPGCQKLLFPSDVGRANSTKSPTIEVRCYHYEQAFADHKRRVKDGRGFFVHEHLVRERSKFLAETIGRQKTGSEKKVAIYMRAESPYVSTWIDWLYGQPMFPHWEDVVHDGVLEDFVEMFCLANRNEDYDCMNLCLDAIRGLFL